MTMGDARLSVEIEKRREIVEQVGAIHRLEGFTPENALDWFKELTEVYILGKVTAETVTHRALAVIRQGKF